LADDGNGVTDVSERALLLAPRGRDTEVASRMLAEAGIASTACRDLIELRRELDGGAGLAVITEESLVHADLREISAWIEAQPEWSDFPFVLLTHRGGGLERNPMAARNLRTLGNVTFVERPFHPTTLVSLVEAALRGRRRQYEARHRLEMLRESEQQFRSLANSIPTLCWSAWPDGHIFWYNQQWYDYTGRTPADMEGWGWQSVHDPDVLPDVTARWQAAIAAGTPFEMVFPLRGADGAFRPFLTRIQPIRDESGTIERWVGTNTDISHQRQAEDALRRLADELEIRVDERTREREIALAQLHEAQKLESIGQLTGGIAHDFNNLLTPVSAISNCCACGCPPTRRPNALSIRRCKRRAAPATFGQRLLAFARRQDLQPRAVDVGALINGIHDLIARTIGPSVDVRVSIDDGVPPALIDPNQLELAILNLAINARDAMPDGGRLTIALSAERSASGSSFVVVTVADTGSGMDEATMQRAVEPFFSTKEPGKGTGLGLSMVHGLVAQSEAGSRSPAKSVSERASSFAYPKAKSPRHPMR
jgi:PAS domain S-box-containing protein